MFSFLASDFRYFLFVSKYELVSTRANLCELEADSGTNRHMER